MEFTYTKLGHMTTFHCGDVCVVITTNHRYENINIYDDTMIYIDIMDKEDLSKERAVELLLMVADNVTIRKIKN